MNEHRVEELTHALFLKLAEQARFWLSLLGIVIVAVGVWFGLDYLNHKKNAEASQAWYELEKQRDQLISEGSVTSLADLAVHKDARFEKLLGDFRSMIEKFGQSQVGPLMRLELAALQARAARFEDAQADYAAAVKSFSLDSPYRAMGLNGQGFCFRQLNKLDDAARVLEEALTLPANPQRDVTLYELARVDLARGQSDKAKEHFERLQKDFSSSPLAARARERLAEISAK